MVRFRHPHALSVRLRDQASGQQLRASQAFRTTHLPFQPALPVQPAAGELALRQLVAEPAGHSQLAIEGEQARHAGTGRILSFQRARGDQAVGQRTAQRRVHVGRLDVRDGLAEVLDAEGVQRSRVQGDPRMPDRVRRGRRQCARLAAGAHAVEESEQAFGGAGEKKDIQRNVFEFEWRGALPEGVKGGGNLRVRLPVAGGLAHPHRAEAVDAVQQCHDVISYYCCFVGSNIAGQYDNLMTSTLSEFSCEVSGRGSGTAR
jgi:hypothetical protein